MNRLALLPTILSLLLIGGCATNKEKPDHNAERKMFNSAFDSGADTMSGFKYVEAKELVEFCVELNSQDDRKKPPENSDPEVYKPKLDSSKWQVKFDSRKQVSEAPPDIKLTQECKNKNKDERKEDPNCNGFGPFQNAWMLYQDTTATDTYVIAIRGTVFSNSPTLIEDMLATTILAKDGIEFKKNKFASVRFSDLSDAEVHAGFAYGTFMTLFNNDYGILKQLEEQRIPAGAKIYIVGHSQGASMATLVHAFLHYAMRDNQFGLGEKGFKLKSYAFAQPKPGNHVFSMDFANITRQHNNAIVINNTLDPVPKVPFTFELASDWASDIQGRGFWISVIHGVANAGMKFRGLFSSAVEEKIAKTKDIDKFYRADDLVRDEQTNMPTGVSLNYVSAGLIIPLDGYAVKKGDMTTPYTGQPNDKFIQHHAVTYRQLIDEKFGSSK